MMYPRIGSVNVVLKNVTGELAIGSHLTLALVPWEGRVTFAFWTGEKFGEGGISVPPVRPAN